MKIYTQFAFVAFWSGCFGLFAQTSHPPLGTVTESTEACPAGPIANTACRRFEVSCPDLKPILVSVRITEPAPNIAFRGTVVMGSGSAGNSFYGGDGPGQILVKD